MSNGYDYEQDPQAEPGGGAGRGRRRRGQPHEDYPEVPPQHQPGEYQHEPGDYPQPQYEEYGRPEYSSSEFSPADYPRAEYASPDYPASDYPKPAGYDPQWEQSGLGWDPQAWREASSAEPRWDEAGWTDPAAAPGPAWPEPQWSERERAAHDRAEPDWSESDWDRSHAPGSDRDFESFEPRRPIPGPASSYDSYDPPGYERDLDRFDDEPLAHENDVEPTSLEPTAPPKAASPKSAPPKSASQIAPAAGRGVFGAAGLAVVVGISAVAGTPVLAVVVGLSQIGIAIGWQRTAGAPKRYLTIGLVALIGLAASAIAYRLDIEHAPGAIATAVGVGFVLLAADQLMHKEADTAPGPHRLEALAAAGAGAAFAALPAGYLVAQRQDSKLTGACALAAAVAVLCSALVGGGTRAIGVVAAAGAGAAVGALTALSLASAAGAKGGAIGGVAAGLLAAVAARIADRLGTEGADVRISSQTFPMAFAAVGAAIAASVVR
jgi:hypothetical protein